MAASGTRPAAVAWGNAPGSMGRGEEHNESNRTAPATVSELPKSKKASWRGGHSWRPRVGLTKFDQAAAFFWEWGGVTHMVKSAVTVVLLMVLAGGANAQTALPGTEEFGLTSRELVQAVEKVEALIAQCMREQGFEYVAADYNTVRRGMSAMMSLPGLDEEEFIAEHGFGMSTLYTGRAPQLADGYSPGKVGLGERNVQIFNNLSPADQIAYNRALLGENSDMTFAVALDIEDFSRCGGCTLQAIEQVFEPEQLKEAYYNPRDALILKDPRMRNVLREYADEMHENGFDYTVPEEVEADVRERLYAITGGGTVPLEELSPEQLTALGDLQEYERRVSMINYTLEEKLIEPVEEQIEEELFTRGVPQ